MNPPNYYTQQLAQYYLRTVASVPNDIVIPKEYRAGLTNTEFLCALEQYREIRCMILSDVAANPGAFDLVCLEIEPAHSAVSKNEAKSIKSFMRIRQVLTVIAKKSIEGSLYRKEDFRGIVRFAEILDRLEDYGFIKEELDSTFFRITYPDHPNVLRVMHALAEAGEDLIAGDPRIFLSNGKISYEPEDVVRLIPQEHIKELVFALIRLFRERGYCFNTKYEYNPAKIWIFKNKLEKPSVIMNLERDSHLDIHLRLSHISEYQTMLQTLSPGILHQTLSGRDCVHCGYCRKIGPAFTYNGVNYVKCSVICAGFHYSSLQIAPQDTASLIALITEELDACDKERSVADES